MRHFYENIKKEKIQNTLLIIICVFILINNLLILKSIQSTGYAIDIYKQLPTNFYVGIICCFFISSILMFKKQETTAIYLLFFITIEVLIIPYMLGYYWMDRADDLTYLGQSTYITEYSHINPYDVYPASHIIDSIISQITNLKVNVSSYILCTYLCLLFILGMIIFSRKYIVKSQIYSTVLISSFIFYFGRFHFSIAPHYVFFCLLPYYFYIITMRLKLKNISVSVCMILLLFLTPFTHPFIILFIVTAFIAISILSIYSKIDINNLKTNLVILVTCFFLWFVSNKGYLNNFKIVYTVFINSLSQTALDETVIEISKVNMNTLELIQLINIYVGRYYIPALIIFASMLIIYKNKSKYTKEFIKNYWILTLIYTSCVIFQLLLVLNPIIPHKPDRFINLNFAVIAQIPLFAYSIYIIAQDRIPSQKRLFIVTFTLTMIWGLSFFGAFNSPYIYKPNGALTYNELDGMEWFYQFKENYSVTTPITQINRFNHLFGNLEAKENIMTLPDHFGYNLSKKNFSEINLNNRQHAYIIITSFDEFVYQKVPGFIDVGRYNNRDFENLRKDMSVKKIYDSLNIQIYLS